MSWVWVFVVVYGISYGLRIPLESAMRARYFGPKAFASIYGYMNVLAQVGSFGDPFFTGWVFDVTGSYMSAFLIFAAMLVLAAIIMSFVKSPMEHLAGKHPKSWH